MSPRGGRQRWRAMTRASTHKPALRCSAIDQPTISRVARSLMAARYRKPSSVGIYERYCRRIRRAAREGTAVEARSGTILLLAALIPLCHPAFAQGPSPPNQVQRIRRQYQTYLKVHGRWCYLYRAIDRNGTLVDVLLSEHRDMAAAQAFFRSAQAVTGVTPDRVTTDGHDSYPRAIRTTLASVCGTGPVPT